MRQLSFFSAAVLLFVCGAVASAGVVGTYAVVAPMMAGASPTTSEVRVFVDDYLPVRVQKSVNGTLAPANGGGVAFVRKGQLIHNVPIGASGTVQARNLGYGPYSIFIDGPDGFAALGAWISPASDDLGTPGAGIEVALVPPTDMPIVTGIIQNHFHPGAATPLAQADAGNRTISGGHDQDGRFRDDFVATAASKSSLLQGHGFDLGDNGRIVGRIVRSAPPSEPEPPLSGLDVYFIQSGEVIGNDQTDADGIFSLSGLSAGIYSLVVASDDAFLALATEVHPPLPVPVEGVPSVTQIPFGDPTPEGVETKLVSAFATQTNVAQVSPVFPSDLGFLPGGPSGPGGPGAPPTPFGPGGGGGFGGGPGGGLAGGGGFAGGGGGLGALLGLGALGLGAAALADDDNDGGVQVISPAIP